MPDLKDYRVTLKDGRHLGVCECGDPSGKPVVYFHGFPGSRLEILFADQAAAQAGIRLIGAVRPGYGRSTPRTCHTLTDWSDDIRELAQGLKIERFDLLGVSGGGPYALACAATLSDRLIRVGIVCGLGPLQDFQTAASMTWVNRLGLKFAARRPKVTGWLFIPVAYLLRHHPEAVLRFMVKRAIEPDRRVMQGPHIRRVMCRSFAESMRCGPAGALCDLNLYTRPWRFSPAKIRVPVRLWHGEKDVMVPAAMGKALAASIPHCTARFYPEEGHFSLIIHHMSQVLSAFAESP
jgi:pimeloyl-ACP methyl ester carboxylesterase